MALTSYSGLVDAIGAWVHRSDLTNVIPDFIRMAESRMQNDLNIRQLDKVSTLTTTGGSNSLALPEDFNQLRSLSLISSGVTQVLDAMHPDMLIQRWGSYGSALPRTYAIRGSNFLLGPTPDSAYTVTIEYASTIPGLTQSNTTNTVLTAYPEAYLHCCMIFAGQYIRDMDLVAGMEQLYAADVERINAQNWAQMGNMTMRTG